MKKATLLGWMSVLGIMALVFVFSGVALAEPNEPTWINVYGSVDSDSGRPVEVGAEVRAFDSAGTVCGSIKVTTGGEFGLLPCTIDDPTTPEDEGVTAGDTVTFRVNGRNATPPLVLRSEIALGDLYEHDLVVAGSARDSEPVTVPEPFTIVLFATGLAGLTGFATARQRRR